MNIYPRKYICDNCGHQEAYNKKAHKRFRIMFRKNDRLQQRKDIPLFFECHMCHDGVLKPKNYKGPEGYVIPILDF